MAKAPRQIPKALGVEFNDAIDVSFDAFIEFLIETYNSGDAEHARYGDLKSIFFRLNNYLGDSQNLSGLHKSNGKIDSNHILGVAAMNIKDIFKYKSLMNPDDAKEALEFRDEFREKYRYAAEYLNEFKFKSVRKKLEHIADDIPHNFKTDKYDPAELRESLRELVASYVDAKSQGWSTDFMRRFDQRLNKIFDYITYKEECAGLVYKHPFREMDEMRKHVLRCE